MRHLLDTTLDDLKRWFTDAGLPAYRAGQVRSWLFENRASDWDAMTNLGKGLRTQLADEFQIWSSRIVRHRQAKDGTEKLLLEFAAGGQIECVLLRDGVRRTICISTQVGCAMGCVFCASGLDGVDRNLSTGEIVEQMLQLQRLLPDDERLSHIVVMGMGEPLANFDHLLDALSQASDSAGLGISPRRITISTVGLPPAIHRLADLNCRYNLAVSLHAPNDELRTKIVPVNKNIGLSTIVEAADRYFEVSGRRLTFEYVLLADINDTVACAQQLVKLLSGRPALLNIIPYNPVDGLPYQTPSTTALRQFRQILEAGGINIQVRQRKGDKIDAACGQLRRITPKDPTFVKPPTA